MNPHPYPSDGKLRPQEEFHITGNWNRISKQLLEDHESLVPQDVILIEGREDDLLKRLTVCLHISRHEALHLIQRAQSRC